MKTIRITISFVAFLIFFSSCTEVIELDLKNTEPRIIIEAVLNVSDSTFRSDISMSNEFYETDDFTRITNATVLLQKKDGTTYNIPETEPGVYFLNNIIALPGEDFSVGITDSEGNVYEASALTPFPVEIGAFIPAPFVPPGGGQPGDTSEYYQLTTLWKDSLGVDNYYRVKTYINNKFNSNDYLLADDRLSDGDTIGAITFLELYRGDLFKLELLSTNQEYFKFFMDVLLALGQGPNSTTPYNPKGNFNNNAIGYFGIYSVSKLEFILP